MTLLLACQIQQPNAWIYWIICVADPTPTEIEKCMLQGLECLSESDLEGAKKAFERSIAMKETPGQSLYSDVQIDCCRADRFAYSCALQSCFGVNCHRRESMKL